MDGRARDWKDTERGTGTGAGNVLEVKIIAQGNAAQGPGQHTGWKPRYV